MSSPKKYLWTTSKVATRQHETPGQAIPHNSRKLHWAYRCDGEGLMEITWVGLSGWWLLTLRNLTCMEIYIYILEKGRVFLHVFSSFVGIHMEKTSFLWKVIYRLSWDPCMDYIYRYNCTHLCFCSLFVNSHNPNGYLLAWNNPKKVPTTEWFCFAVQGIQLVSSHEVGPLTSYKWNYMGPLQLGVILLQGNPFILGHL